MESTERPRSRGTWPFLTGMASVLDLHGHPAWFEELAATPPAPSAAGSDADADVRAVGQDLERSLMLHAASLSAEKQRALAQILNRLLETSNSNLLHRGSLREKQLELDLLSGLTSR